MIRSFEAILVVNACTTNNTNNKQGSHHARQGTPLLRPRTAFPMRRHLLPSCRLAHRIFAVTRLLCVVPGARQLYARAQRSGSTVLTLRRSTTCCCPPPPIPPSLPSSHFQSAGLNFYGCSWPTPCVAAVQQRHARGAAAACRQSLTRQYPLIMAVAQMQNGAKVSQVLM